MLDDAATRDLAGTRFTELRWHDSVDSTNQVVADLARDGAPEGLVVVADYQTAGRGRLGRRWQAPPGSSLLFSVLLRPEMSGDHVHLATVAIAVAASEGCAEAVKVYPHIKWPNDLVVDDRKVGGMLGERVVSDGGVALVVGLGLNVNWPTPPPPPGVALDELVGRPVDRQAVLVAILRSLDAQYQCLRSPSGVAALLARYRSLSATIGRRVRIDLWAGAIEGVAADITDHGHLVVDDGERKRVVASGDVVHLRPA